MSSQHTCDGFRDPTNALDQAGQTRRQIADQLGQARVSLAQDVYLGRQAANPSAAEALERAFETPDLL